MMQLNLVKACTTNIGEGEKSLESQQHVEERTSRKRAASPLSQEDPDQSDFKEDEHGQRRKRLKKAKDVADGGALSGKGGDFVSSLFNHNPEIPNLQLGSAVPVHEDVFTERTFEDIGVHPYLVQNLQAMGLEKLTLVQNKAIPTINAGKDVLVKSQTGSGKTLAYAIPILQSLQAIRPKLSRSDGVHALIIVPTRELAIQTFEWLQKLCKSFAWIVPGALYGGEKKKSEKARMRKGLNILVATPGRLIDHLVHTKCLSVSKVKVVVLDEADRMLELGYERDVRQILDTLDEAQCNRQTLLLSATLTTGIEQLSEVSMKHPVFVDAAETSHSGKDLRSQDQQHLLTTPSNLKQNFVIVPAKLRLVLLASFVLWKCRFGRARKMLVFLATQDMVDYHMELFENCLNSKEDAQDVEGSDAIGGDVALSEDARKLLSSEKNLLKGASGAKNVKSTKRIELFKLHGSMKQSERTHVFKMFRESGNSGVLLCTDVASRGLDLPQVDWIVQYNPPTCVADYVHRVGRTARAGSAGSSLLFVLPSEANFVQELESLNLSLAELTVEQALEKLLLNAEPSRRTGMPPRNVEEAATNLQMNFENAVLGDKALHQSACQAYVSYVRSYASYPKEARDTFNFKALHLGHVAKSYALRDPPTKITGLGKGNWAKKEQLRKKDSSATVPSKTANLAKSSSAATDLKREQKIIGAQKKRINQKALITSEFATGFDGISDGPKLKKK